MQIEMLKVKDLIPYERNPRNNKDAVDVVANSIKEFGFKNPIIIDKDNVIVAGHTRLLAAKKLKIKEVPCVRADDLTDEQVKAFRIADNSTAQVAEWDFDLLKFEIEDLPEFDFADFGLEFETETEEPAEIIEDDYDVEPPAETIAKLGDIWQLGRHRLMCGDSTDVLNLEKLFNGNKIDLVLTDPPYGISIVGSNGQVGAGNLASNGVYMPVKGDETTETTREFYNACVAQQLKKYILFGGNYFTEFLPFSDSWIIWDKRGEMTSNNFADGEMAWCSFHTPVRIYKQIWNGMIREGEHEKRVHPTQKPVRMLADILKDFTRECDNIFDGFGGSGSTLMACEQTNRNCYMIEYEPHYVDVIINRWEQFTGEKAVLING